MQELINSIVRLSAAATLYSLQQVQTSVSELDTKDSINSLRAVMDGVTKALISRLDENKKEILDNLAEAGNDVAVAIERDIKEMKDTADEVIHRTLNATREISQIGSRRAAKKADVKPMASVKKAAPAKKPVKAAAKVATKVAAKVAAAQ